VQVNIGSAGECGADCLIREQGALKSSDNWKNLTPH
jgi:hypothetical protein